MYLITAQFAILLETHLCTYIIYCYYSNNNNNYRAITKQKAVFCAQTEKCTEGKRIGKKKNREKNYSKIQNPYIFVR